MTELITTAELDVAWVDLSGVTSALTTWTVTSPDGTPRTPLVRPIIIRFPDSADPDRERRHQFHELLEALHEVIDGIMAGLDKRSWARRLWQELAHAGEDLRDLIADDRTVAPDDACNDPRAHLAYVSWGMVVPPLLVPTWRHPIEDHPPDEAYKLLFEP